MAQATPRLDCIYSASCSSSVIADLTTRQKLRRHRRRGVIDRHAGVIADDQSLPFRFGVAGRHAL